MYVFLEFDEYLKLSKIEKISENKIYLSLKFVFIKNGCSIRKWVVVYLQNL